MPIMRNTSAVVHKTVSMRAGSVFIQQTERSIDAKDSKAYLRLHRIWCEGTGARPPSTVPGEKQAILAFGITQTHFFMSGIPFQQPGVHSELTHVSPGEQVVLRFKATKAGVYVYHCAPGGIMIPWHVVSGMNGAILVLPRDGLKDAKGKPVRYDRAYYIGEQDFYIPKDAQGKYKTYASPAAGMAEMLEVMRTLTPTHIVFNGAVGALTGDNALKAKVGEKVLFIHSQANRDSRPHLIGGHGDLVWQGRSFSDVPATNLETWFVAGGSATAALYQFKQPGLHVYLNHNLIEAVMLGAAAHVQVEGTWDNDLMQQINKPGPIPKD